MTARADSTGKQGAFSDEERSAIARDFKDVVNMTSSQLQQWLESDESQRVGQKKDGDESVGHESGRRILKILSAEADRWSDDDYAHMRKVVGYVHRHMTQGPTRQDIETSDWRFSLMNWGHDPLIDK